MTDAPTCRPPPEFEGERWHWLKFDEPGALTFAAGWHRDHWMPWRTATVEQVYAFGVRYVAPCRPDDATERARLEAENARLRGALEKLVDEFGCSIELYHRLGPDYTFKDGTQVFGIAVLLDREELITSAKAILDPVTGEGE